MADSETKPDVNAIMEEVRRGMQDNDVPRPDDAGEADRRELRASLRRATETASVLGRCGGSMRGKLCKLLAPLALPVLEQLNLHHAAVVAALKHIRRPGEGADSVEARLAKLEAEVEALKRESGS
jgi:hypothetical protein